MPAIDFRVRLRTEEGCPEILPVVRPEYARYIPVYNMQDRLSPLAIDEQIGMHDAAEIEKAVLCSPSVETNQWIYEQVHTHPDKFVGFSAINPMRGVGRCFSEAMRAFDDYGFPGLSTSPYASGVPMDDRRMYPIYALAEERKKIVIIHSSLHFNTSTSFDLGNPAHMDQVAIDFPKLKIVMSHAGSGFGLTPLWIAQRHENIYLEFSALRPKYIQREIMMALNGFLKNRVLWGSDYPCLAFDSWNDWKEYVKPEVFPKFIYENAKKLLEGATG